MFREAKKELREKVGKKKAKILLEKHMDVVGTPHSIIPYFLHWLPDGALIPVGLVEYKKCGCIAEARAEAIYFLLKKLYPVVERLEGKGEQ